MDTKFECDFSELTRIPETLAPAILFTGTTNFISEETHPETYFPIVDGLLKFNYTSVSGLNTERHGVAAFHPGIMSRAVQLNLRFVNPLQYFNRPDEFHFRIEIGVVSQGVLDTWRAGFIETHYDGNWQKRLFLGNVSVNDLVPTDAVESKEVEDISKYYDENELQVTFENGYLTTILNGVSQVKTAIDFRGLSHSVIHVEFYSRKGADVISFPLVPSFTEEQLLSGMPSMSKEIPGMFLPLQLDEAHFYAIPVVELEAEGSLKCVGGYRWEFTRDVDIRLEGQKPLRATAGAVIVGERIDSPRAGVVSCKFRYL